MKMRYLTTSLIAAFGTSVLQAAPPELPTQINANPLIPTEWSKPKANGKYSCQVPDSVRVSFNTNRTKNARYNTDLTGYGCREVQYVADEVWGEQKGEPFKLYDGREFSEMGFFENTIAQDAPVRSIVAESTFDNDADYVSDITKGVNASIRWLSNKGGGIFKILPNDNGQSRIALGEVTLLSNVRIEVHPDITIEMAPTYKTQKTPDGNELEVIRSTLFQIGKSKGPNNLLSERVENVAVTSMVIEGREDDQFTVDARTSMPFNYGKMSGGNGDGIVNLTRAVVVTINYAKNFKVANINMLDNHTESVAVQMFSDPDYQDGAYANRHGSPVIYLQNRYDKEGNNEPLETIDDDPKSNFVNDNGSTLPDMFAIKRNPTYGRTPIKGTITNVRSENAHTGYGVVQVYGGDWISIENIHAINGIGVRVEAGNGTDRDNFNRSGPYFTSANRIKIKNVVVENGFTGVWLKTHAKVMKDLYVENVTAIDSGSAILVGKGSFGCETDCRDLTRGRINGLTIKGNIKLEQTVYDKPVAEIGRLATFFTTPFHSEYLAYMHNLDSTDALGREHLKVKNVDVNMPEDEWQYLTPNDFDVPSGTRWYTIFPTAPVLLPAQMAMNDTGLQSTDKGFFPVDMSKANLNIKNVQCKGYNAGVNILNGPKCTAKVMYRSEMHDPNGSAANDMIDK
ncbi:hypothetical protein RCJ22_28650 [Vibrio sp. FNV 38]|nr:hypothetical protein [Vibrio sp. FNV 38]